MLHMFIDDTLTYFYISSAESISEPNPLKAYNARNF
jgi:hypothetical protein